MEAKKSELAAARILARHLRERCGTGVEPRISLEIDATIGAEGFAISDGRDGAITVAGADRRGLVYGVGKLLRTSRYDGGFTPGKWRGTSVPKLPVRGIYFATHFHNFYHDAPVEEITRYVEDLALWGYNAFVVWYHMVHFNGWDDPEAEAFRSRLRCILEAATNVGIDVGLGVVANEGYANSPVEFRADPAGMRGSILPTDICTSNPEGQRYVLDNFSQLFDWAADLDPAYVWIWPYDSGGCGCDRCRPWGSNGFPKAAEKLARLIKGKLANAKVILSTWFLDDDEWQWLYDALGTPDWADYLLSVPQTPAFMGSPPGGLPLVGFPEISMNDMWPWGGFGANPHPNRCQQYWDQVKGEAVGGFPYSEGIYEDINKAVFAGLYWDPDRSAADIIREYAAFEFSPGVANEVSRIITILEANHHFRWWPGLLDGYEGWFPSRDAAPREDPGAEEAYDLAKAVDSKLTPQARASWRWRIIYLRVLLDCELKNNGGRPNDACEAAFEELTRIYFAQNAITDLKPPGGNRGSAEKIRRRGE